MLFFQHLIELDQDANPYLRQTRLQSPYGRADQLDRFTGTYRLNDYSHNSIAKLLRLQDDDLPQVVASADSIGIQWLTDAPAPLIPPVSARW